MVAMKEGIVDDGGFCHYLKAFSSMSRLTRLCSSAQYNDHGGYNM